jgi:hypothetical protein
MASHDNDPPEFTGRDRTVKADPPKTSRAPAVATVAPAVAPLAAPVATTVVEPVKPISHPKHAIVRPRKDWEAAMAETQAARQELVAAASELKIAEHAEGAALVDWLALNKAPTPDAVYREHVARSQRDRAAAVAAGKNPDATAAPVVNRSPIDQHALNRGKAAARSGTPLRSNVVRR